MHPDHIAERERILRDAALAGDAGAWRELFDAAFSPLWEYVRWRCGGQNDWAEDMLQETWVIAVDRLGTFDSARAPFRAWMRGIAANVIRNHLRRNRVRRGHEHNGVPDVADERESGRERGRRVMQALAELPERYESVLRAKYLDRRCVADIAAESGQTVKAIESLLTRARQAFREVFQAEE